MQGMQGSRESRMRPSSWPNSAQEKARPKRAETKRKVWEIEDRDSDEDEWFEKPKASKARAKPKEKAAASSSKSPG